MSVVGVLQAGRVVNKLGAAGEVEKVSRGSWLKAGRKQRANARTRARFLGHFACLVIDPRTDGEVRQERFEPSRDKTKTNS